MSYASVNRVSPKDDVTSFIIEGVLIGSLEANAHPSIPLTDVRSRFTVPKGSPFIHQSIDGSWNGRLNGATLNALDRVRTEFWAIGTRNPWQIHFDSKTGDLWMADVGGGSWEEVNIVT